MFHSFHSFITALLACAALAPVAAWPADPTDPQAGVPPAAYRSAFEAYRTHTGVAAGNWRDANERVGRTAGGHDHGAAAPQAAGAPADAAPSAHDHGAKTPADGAPAAKAQACGKHEQHHGAGAMKHGQRSACHHEAKEGGDEHKH